MAARFELFVARRYLRARRKEAVISIITMISIAGVAAGVMALVIALAVNNGFRGTLQRNLLGAMAHINVQTKAAGEGIENWRQVLDRVRKVRHVAGASAALYSQVLLSGPMQARGAVLKGVDLNAELQTSDLLRHLKDGTAERLNTQKDPPALILGSRLAEDAGMVMNANVSVISPQGELTPLGPRPSTWRFRVVGLFESGFFEIDDLWAFTSIDAAQRMLSLTDVVNQIEVKVDDLERTESVAKDIEKVLGPDYVVTTWMERNKQLNSALRMERVVTIITIGLIELVAALNIFITLVMMVMEKYRDIGVLMSMGARRRQIRNIFMLQGVLIGVIGSGIGLILGYSISLLANKYRWVRLPEEVYSLSFVPFEPRWIDALWIAAAAILVSFLATIYPARNATRISPVEVIRYE